MVSGSISPPYSGYFSPFPHGTGSLSVSQEYLALPDGAGGFRRDFSGPALLRIPLGPRSLRKRDSHPLWSFFPECYASLLGPTAWSYNPTSAVTEMVWALPRSLATTCGIICYFLFLRVLRCFSSPGSPPCGYLNFIQVGCPIRTSADHIVCADPRGFSQLVASFLASESLGIPHAPFSAFSPALSLGPARFFFLPHAYQVSVCHFILSFPSCQRTFFKVRVRSDELKLNPCPCLFLK